MKLKDLAQGLGISPAMVTKLRQRGMPTGSVEDAAKWRRNHLEPARTKGVRADTMPVAPVVRLRAKPAAAAPSWQDVDQALVRVRELGLLAHDALGRGAFAAVAPMLRQAMAAVPIEARERVALSVEVWDALTEAIPLDLQPTEAQAAAGDLSDDFMATFWYQIALGPELADMRIVSK